MHPTGLTLDRGGECTLISEMCIGGVQPATFAGTRTSCIVTSMSLQSKVLRDSPVSYIDF